MFRLIENVLSTKQIAQLRDISAKANFVDGKISNPHSKVKSNLQIHDQNLQQESVNIMAQAMFANEDFVNFAIPKHFAPPMICRYTPGMKYGLHPDVAMMQIGNVSVRSDLSATIFINDPEAYEGGHLRIVLGTEDIRIKGPAGSVVVYPSSTLHEVEEVTEGERLVAITFIQSQVPDSFQRELLYELGEVAALEGNQMDYANYTRLQAVQFNLKRMWSRG